METEFEVAWTGRAVASFEEVLDYIASFNVAASERFKKTLLKYPLRIRITTPAFAALMTGTITASAQPTKELPLIATDKGAITDLTVTPGGLMLYWLDELRVTTKENGCLRFRPTV